MATAEDAAQWMWEQVKAGYLNQSDAVDHIAKAFGEQFTYTNNNGNAAIDRKVLAAFKKLHQGAAEWDNYNRCWNMRS